MAYAPRNPVGQALSTCCTRIGVSLPLENSKCSPALLSHRHREYHALRTAPARVLVTTRAGIGWNGGPCWQHPRKRAAHGFDSRPSRKLPRVRSPRLYMGSSDKQREFPLRQIPYPANEGGPEDLASNPDQDPLYLQRTRQMMPKPSPAHKFEPKSLCVAFRFFFSRRVLTRIDIHCLRTLAIDQTLILFPSSCS